MTPRLKRSRLAVLAAVLAIPTALRAQDAAPTQRQSPIPGPVGTTPPTTEPAPGAPGFTTDLFSASRSNLLGDAFGVRTALGEYGVTLGLQETSELFGNATGGVHTGAAYSGLTVLGLGLDTEKAFGWDGGTFNVSAFQIHGGNLAADNLRSLQTPSSIEATRSTRLWELWYQQAFLDGRIDVKIGQQSLDQEFIVSQGGATFINAAMGWPVVPSSDLYAGGPAYPLASLGVRARARPTRSVTLLAGVFDDNPPGGPFNDDSQVRGAAQSGTAFNLGTGALFIAEIQYAIHQPSEGTPADLPGTYKLGAWYDTGVFPDQRFDTFGLSLANPSNNGAARLRRHNWSVYGVADQVVWQPNPQQPRSVGVFGRVMGAPGDRNLVDFGMNAGIVVRAPLPGRNDDTLGIGYGLARISHRASQLDQDIAFYRQTPYPVRSSESFLELTYQIQLAGWWNLQPDFQYVFTPSGGVPNPNDPTRRVGNEAIFGLRTNVIF